MTDERPEWLHYPCYYVTAGEGNRPTTLLAGPYRTRQLAEGVLDKAREWAIKESRDQRGSGCVYAVSLKLHGYDRSILGMIEP